MGVRFSPGEASWSYSGFHAFRERLSRTIGINLGEMKGFGGDKSWGEVHDDIVGLLNHADCEGDLLPAECQRIAPRLRELVLPWKPTPDSDEGYDRRMGLRLAEGMEIAADSGVPLEFR